MKVRTFPSSFTLALTPIDIRVGDLILVDTHYKGEVKGTVTEITINDEEVDGRTTVIYEDERGDEFWCLLTQVITKLN